MLAPSDYARFRRDHGFARRMRRLIRTSALPYGVKSELCAALARSGPDAAWEIYKQQNGQTGGTHDA